ncbi:TonB-dependent receptor [Pseudomaricurvus alkylphenolicus]|uniref:TonB-dependent receptor n=1 Tax=Pseudomaricurvus alkylphenolicus TaxID=1306991 RepID=UPI001424A1B1|nr:TonB-dependent receptor [Pseudomaricurvus alkylphenolicus]NIB43435.1 TonB-dependent receptor [Pseudomaricurvus alkylphenolicus]
MRKGQFLKQSLLAAAIASAAQMNAHSDSGGGLVLEEVVITAQRKVESIQDAAIAVDAVSQEELVRNGITDATGLNKISPALTVLSGGGSNNIFFVRGVGNFAVNAYTDSALAFNVDGVYIGRPTATTASFLDVERVEVLKGPQGTLYGRNATAGAINVLPTKPELGETSGNLSLGVGNYGSLEVTGAMTLELSDKWAARLALSKVENNGYNDDDTAATDDMALRAQLFGELSDSVDVRFSLDYSTTEGTGNAPDFLGTYGFNFIPSNNPNNISGYNFNPAPASVAEAHTGPGTPEAQAYYASLNTTPAFTSTAPQLDPFVDNRYLGLTAELNFDLGFGELVVIPAYREAEIDAVFIVPGFQAAFNQEDHQQVSLEARLNASTGPVDWILGAYYFDETVEGLAAFNQQSLQSTQTIDESTTESQALFARGTWNLSDELRLVAAVRWTEDQKAFDGVANTILNLCIRELPLFPGGPEIPNCAGAPIVPAGATVGETLAQIDPADLPAGAPGIGTGPVPYGAVPLVPGMPELGSANLLMINPTAVDRSLKTDEVTYRVALEYDITPDNLVYTSFETGYRSGGFSLALGHESFAPEFLDAFTIGSKNRFWEDRLQLNAELFVWDYTDQQASHFGVDSSGNNAFFTENIGKSTIKGLEVDVLFAATESTRVRANLQYLDNEIKEFAYTQLTPDIGVQVVTGCDTVLNQEVANGATWNVDCSGKEGRNSPQLSVNVGIDQAFQFGDLDALLSLDMRYRDERWVGFDYTPMQREDAVTTLDASFELGAGDGSWSVLAYVRNLTDEEVKSMTQVLGTVSNLVSTVYEPPRTYGLRLNYTF